MSSRHDDFVEDLHYSCDQEVASLIVKAGNRNFYPGCNTIEAVHLLVNLHQYQTELFDVVRLNGDHYHVFKPSHTALKNAIRAVMPARKGGGRGEMQFGRTAVDVYKRAQELTRSGSCIEISHFTLALLLRKDIQAVLKKAGYTVHELRTLREDLVELCISETRPRVALKDLRRQELYVLQGLAPKQMAAVSRAGVQAKHFSEKSCPVEGVAVEGERALARVCSVLRMDLFARQRVAVTEGEQIIHAVLQPKQRKKRSAIKAACELESIDDFECEGDGWDDYGKFREAMQNLFDQHVVPHVDANVFVGSKESHSASDEDDEVFVARICFSHEEMRSEARELQKARKLQAVRVILSDDEVQRATYHELQGDGPGYVYADIYDRDMMIRMHSGLFKDHGTRMILLDSLLRKCVPHLKSDTRLQDFVDAFATDDLPAAPLKSLTLSGFYREDMRTKFVEALVHGVFMRGLTSRVVLHESGRPREEVVPADGRYHVYFPRRGAGLEACPPLPSGDAVPMLDESSGRIVAELSARSLRIYKDFLPRAGYADLEPLAKFLQDARAQRLMAARYPLAKQMVAQKFATECLYTLKKREPGSKKAVASGLSKASDEFVRQIQRSRNLEYRTAEIANLAESEFGSEFDSLMQLEKVKNIEVSHDKLIVKTHTIFCRDERTNRLHELGEFEITIPFDSGNVRFINLTRTVGDRVRFHAPHVGESGNACLGNIRDLLPNLVRKRDFVPAVQLCIVFLETANTADSWGRQVDSFPLANRRR